MIVRVVGVLLAAGAVLFVWLRDPMRLPEDAAGTRRIVLQHIPTGTHAAEASSIMEQGGFECVLEDDFYVDDETPSYPWTRQLYCSKSKWGWIGDREWQVFLFLNAGDIVQGVHATYAITAP